jgi:molybdopterin-containing oxidoreductase family iron-sulfur binding subunit
MSHRHHHHDLEHDHGHDHGHAHDHHDHEHDIDIEPVREAISRTTGREFWRSLDELADTDRFRSFLHREFPALNASEADPTMLDSVGRRSFLKLMSASMALAGLTACTVQPKEQIVPYVQKPDGLVPGKPQFFATAMTLGGVASGLLVESHEGRPTKIEGNPDHPTSRGATDIFAQASVLNLYDPDRSKTALKLGDTQQYGLFLNDLTRVLDQQRKKQGAGLRILTETITSPTFKWQMEALLKEFPQAKWHVYEPGTRDGARLGAQIAFGEMVNVIYKFDQADVVLSLDADFMTNGPGAIRYAKDFMSKRRLTNGAKDMNRLYVAESTMTTTGAKADHRLPVRAVDITSFAQAVAAAVGVAGASGTLSGAAQKFVDAVAKDLKAHNGKSIVIAGEHQPASVHAIALAINAALGNLGATVIATDSIEAKPADQIASITELVSEMNAGKVEALIILGGNPVYNAPVFASRQTFLGALQKVPFRVHLSQYNDETSANCNWHISEAHYLEAWSDARAYDGTVSIVQPLILPLYESKSAHELLSTMLGQPTRASYDIVRAYWRGQLGANFDAGWNQALHDGVFAGTALPAKQVSLKGDWAAGLKPVQAGKYEVVFRLDPHVHDGRFANNSWLQETPKPIHKIVWDNYAVISQKTADDLNLSPNAEPKRDEAKLLDIKVEGKTLSMPIWVQPGHPDNSVTVYLGYGRSRAGNVGNNLGFDTYSIRPATAPTIATTDVELASGNGVYMLAATQEHFNIDASGISGVGANAYIAKQDDLADRHIVRVGSLEEYRKNPESVHHGAHKPKKELTIFKPEEYPYDKLPSKDGREVPINAWGMTIDMQACIGCNACVVACQSENNIAVVGKDLVIRGRIMNWLRIDTYFRGDQANPEVYFQPMMCQHCETAPCEVVCPVNATVHDAEGLNVQVYNRCVGTRYCANNCPYKVRRFNYMLYGDWDTPSLKNVRNPEVTIRSRGVMEKCTFCVQRIMNGKIEAEKQNRPVRDGEIQTACQSSCPTDAISFGNLNDKEARVTKLKAEPRNYGVLADLNTNPRTTYLAAVRNPNAELGGGAVHGEGNKSGEKHG